ncbi:hypothetical protein C8F01DRAFT_1022721 [Mycena amicta]|nr:hypothetical protein C8F01DRAFT_1022721 [Mycena amicta]
MPLLLRRVPTPKPTLTRKTALDPAVLPLVDAALKQAKASSRALQLLLASFDDELLVLHRLFYRSNNQHRTALFWRRVSEIRRYAERLEALSLLTLLDSLRFSFFDPDQQQSSKLLKGSWTHYPDKTFVSFVIQRLQGSRTLVRKMHERLAHAYRTFSLAIQTGAFAQLLLALCGITSRMSTLVSELADILQQSIETIQTYLVGT